MAAGSDSYSAVKKVRTYLSAALEYARDERLIAENPARKLELPAKLLPKPCERYYSLEEVRRLMEQAHGREHLILRIFLNCGLRPGELFALREDDVQPGQLRIDQALKDKERGPARVGETKTVASAAYVGISKGLQEELEMWIQARRQQQPYHTFTSAAPSDLLFPTETGTTFRIGNYLKRGLKPPCKARRHLRHDLPGPAPKCATQFQKHGKPRDIQAQLRHSKLEMTGRYVKETPERVRAAVESMDQELCQQREGVGGVQ